MAGRLTDEEVAAIGRRALEAPDAEFFARARQDVAVLLYDLAAWRKEAEQKRRDDTAMEMLWADSCNLLREWLDEDARGFQWYDRLRDLRERTKSSIGEG